MPTPEESPLPSKAVEYAKEAIAATPSLVDQVREIGEEHLELSPDGKDYILRAPDQESAKRLKEMFRDRSKAEQRMTDTLNDPSARRAEIKARAESAERERYQRWIEEGRKRR